MIRGHHAAAPLPVSGPVATVEEVRDLAALGPLQETWDCASSEWPSPMQQYEWTQAAAEVFGAGRQLQILVARRLQGFAAAPLFRTGVPCRLEILGAGELHEPVDFTYSCPSVLVALATELADSRLPVLLNRVLADSPVVPALREAYRGKGVVICRSTAACPWIALDESWQQPETHLNSGRRSDLRRAQRIADSMGRVDFEVVSPSPALLPQLLDEAYRVEAGGWKARTGSALACDPQRGEFYRRYAAAACARGLLRLCFLRIGGRAAAAQLAIESGSRLWILKIGYSDEYARCSPGILVTMHTIRYAASAGLRSYEFLGTVEPWTRVWTKLERPCVSLRAYPASVRGSTALAKDTLAAAWQRARVALRRSK